MPAIRTCTTSTIPHEQAGYMSAWLHSPYCPFSLLTLDIPYLLLIHLVILYFVTVQVCSPAFSLLVHDIMIPCLAAAGVLYTKLCTHPSIRST